MPELKKPELKNLSQILAAFVGAFLLATPSWMTAQRMGSGHFASGTHSFHFNAESNFGGRYGNFGSRYGSLAALPLLTDPLYAESLYDSGYPVASQPPIVILQGAAPARTSDAIAASKQPLMIELQGDRYVQVSGEDNSGAEMVDGNGSVAKHGNSPATSHTVAELPPAILIFRDGHREEVSAYTIADGVLYATGNFYAGGSWNRKIQLSSLNLADTIQSNQSHGVEFRLPTGPNEVMVRP
jgi:hypothetical protein